MKINVNHLTMAVRGLFIVAKQRYPEYKAKFPTDPNGVEITDQNIFDFMDDAEDVMVQMIKDRFDVEITEIEDWINPINDIVSEEPELPYIGTGEKVLATSPVDGQMSESSILQDKAVFKGKLGPDFGRSFTVVWSDGNRLEVSDSSKMKMNGSQNDHRKFQPGGQYSGDNPDIPYMEVYAKRGTHPKEVSIVVDK